MQTVLRKFGLSEYETVCQNMQTFTQQRTKQAADEIWILEHPPVYTLGLSGKRQHLLNVGNIPVVETDRGGQVTYHGPGQLIVYLLLDIQRLNIGARKLVTVIEQAMIASLGQYGIKAKAKPEAPGVYVDNKKIGSIGLRIKRGCSYHGLSFNNTMDLNPFNHINTCGYSDLEVTRLADLGVKISTYELSVPVVHQIIQAINQ